jgi:hypothetical protein
MFEQFLQQRKAPRAQARLKFLWTEYRKADPQAQRSEFVAALASAGFAIKVELGRQWVVGLTE